LSFRSASIYRKRASQKRWAVGRESTGAFFRVTGIVDREKTKAKADLMNFTNGKLTRLLLPSGVFARR
jgi:hypothetical protein